MSDRGQKAKEVKLEKLFG